MAVKNQRRAGYAVVLPENGFDRAHGAMNWDDELADLVTAVYRIFGDEVLQEALSRALVAAGRQSRPITDDSPPADAARIIPAGVFEGLLKMELRRLVRPQ
jgi:hypothetical protein